MKKADFQKKNLPLRGEIGFDLGFWVLKKDRQFCRPFFAILTESKSGLFLS
nr:hypothetical protein P5656_00020 [Bacillus subtilis]